MEAYKRWVRRNKEYLHSFDSLANGLTWLLPERFADSEIVPEAGFVSYFGQTLTFKSLGGFFVTFCVVICAITSVLGIVTTVNEHIIETTPSNAHTKPQECSSFPYSLCLTLMKDVETLVEVIAQQFYGDDNKWNFIAVTEATKVLARLALLHNSAYKMLLHGGETINDGKDTNDANQQQTHIQLSQKGRNGHFTHEGRALSALSRFGENARMISNPTWLHSPEHNQRATIERPETDIKRHTLLSILSEKGLPGGLMLMGEVMFIARPLVYVLLIRKYGPRSWFPWFVSLTIDLIGMSSSTLSSMSGQKDRKLHDFIYLILRRMSQRLESSEKTLEHVPVVGFLAAKLIELLVGAQTRYTYMSGS